MEIFTKAEMELRFEELAQKIWKGVVFLHPTDTIYGIGCNAQNEKAVAEVRKIKDRPDTPFSVWAPSVEWIKKNCVVSKEAEEWLKKLPGPYTLILKLKDKNAVAKNVAPKQNTLGVRIPLHWFSKVIAELNLPLITTSVNKSGLPFMTSLEDLDKEIENQVEFIVYEGEKVARPSKIIDLVKGVEKER